MEITVRGLWTLIHGMGFGALYLLACCGGLVELYRFSTSSVPSNSQQARSVAWFAPISITMVSFVFISYGRDLGNHRQLRIAVLYFAVASFAAADIAGFFGAIFTRNAPVSGGHTIQISRGEER